MQCSAIHGCTSILSRLHVMRENPLPPCDHDRSTWIGIVRAGEMRAGIWTSAEVVTCEACVPASQAYVTAVTGLAGELRRFEDMRREVRSPTPGNRPS